MHPALRSSVALLLVSAVLGCGAALAAGKHAHGEARLDVSIDGPVLVLKLAAPLDSLLGFERAPRNDAERARVQALAQTLRGGAMFVPTAAARCRLERVELSSPVLAPELLGESGAAAGKADDHADLDGSFVYRCEDAKALVSVDVMLFDHFKRLRRIDAQVAGPKGQLAPRLTSKSRQIRWPQ